MKTISRETELREELVNVITHSLGILFGLVSVPLLILNACENCGHYVITGISIYGAAFLLLFFSSSFFHFQTDEKRRTFWKKVDHISIYFMIAGTYTPFILIYVNNSFGFTLLAILWTLAIAGTIFKTYYCGRFEIISTLVYLGMGWMLVTGGNSFFANMPADIMWLIITGAIFYSVGVIFYVWRLFPYHHAVWHIFVLAGAICHYLGILKAVP
ncbi:MAG TPA: hemolysin III family protein [Chitinophagaceae bacterium]|nr:hemolysin III family protein [Chitinophagaceae bacterium]